MEQFIWPNQELPAAIADDTLSQASDKPAEISVSRAEPDALPRIVTLRDIEQPGDAEAWRRQFIGALRDVDREVSAPPPAPEPRSEMLPPLPYVAAPHRAHSRTPTLGRTARLATLAPLARIPRHRVAAPLLGVAAMVALLSVALPRTTNVPDAAEAAKSQSMVLADTQHKSIVADGDILGSAVLGSSVMFNAPVLVREGAAPHSPAAMPNPPARELPVIETLRTVPVFLGRQAGANAPPMPWTPSASQPLAPMPAPQPPPAAAPSPLDRDSLTTLATMPPVAPPLPSAKPEPAPAATAPQKQAEAKPPVEEPRASESGARISSSYERSIPIAKPQARKRPSRAKKKAPARTRQAQWRAPRQGLRTAPPPEEPSKMVKFLKSLIPFSTENKPEAKASASTEKSPAPAAKTDSFWWGTSQSDR